MQNGSVKESLVSKFSLDDFARWVINGNVDSAINVRKLPLILKNEEATKILLRSNIKDAYEKVIMDKPEYKDLKSITVEQRYNEVTNR